MGGGGVRACEAASEGRSGSTSGEYRGYRLQLVRTMRSTCAA